MVSREIIQRARLVLGSVRQVRLSEEEAIEIQDRLALLTVVTGLRPLAAFGFADKNNGGRLESVKRILSEQGLRGLITSQIRPRSYEPLRNEIGDLVEIFDAVDADSYARDSGRLLWVYHDPQQEEQIGKAVNRGIQSGTLLSYPPCCVEHHEAVDAHFQQAFASAIVAAVGRDPATVERALREDVKVEIAGDPTDRHDMVNTDRLYPFVFHAACRHCLASDKSQTAELNNSYEVLARQYDRAFHHWFKEMIKTEVQIEKMIGEAESQKLTPQELKEPSRSQLRELFNRRDKIYSRLC